jgi:hypothetical protein
VRQASLVAFYGRKRGPLGKFLRSCQDRVVHSIQQLGAEARFYPSPLLQMHATVIGLERRCQDTLENRNFHAFRGCSRDMRLPELFRFIISCSHFPIWVQIGGFEDRDYSFQSRGMRPYQRSFSLQGRIAVVIGWPVCAERGTGEQSSVVILEDLRRSFQRFNVLHRWHKTPADVDNDLYIRLGLFEGKLQASECNSVEDELRRALSESPLIEQLTVSDLALVSYPADDETLPTARSKVFQLTDPRLQERDFVAGLYSD